MQTLNTFSKCLVTLAIAGAFTPASAENLLDADVTTTVTATASALTGLTLACPAGADIFYVHQKSPCVATATFADASTVVLNAEKGASVAALTSGLVWSTDNTGVTAPTTCTTTGGCSNPVLAVDKTVTADGSVKVSATLTVAGVSKTATTSVKLYAPIALNASCPSSLVSGGKLAIAVTPQNDPSCAAGTYFSDGVKGDVTPLVQWSSSDSTVATVTGPSLLTPTSPVFLAASYKNGLVQAATVTAASKVNIQVAGAGLTASAPLAITLASTTPLPPTAALLISCPKVLKSGAQNRCYAGFRLSDDTAKLATVTWSSSDSSVVTVDSKGNLTAATVKSSSKATITASYTPTGSTTAQTATAVINVVPAAALSGLVVRCTDTLTSGATGSCRAGAVYSDDDSKDVKPTWTSSNTAAVTVDAEGKLTAKTVTEKTSVTITGSFTDGDVTQTAKDTVVILPASITTPPSKGVTPVSAATIECFFAWAETKYSQLFPTDGAAVATVSFGPYSFRQYAIAKTYLGVETLTNNVIYVGPFSGGQLIRLGDFATVWSGPSGCK